MAAPATPRLIDSAEELRAAYPVMCELRSQLAEDEFVDRTRRQFEQGYRLLAAERHHRFVGLAGFRIADNLAWGHFLYVDDLVTLPDQRSLGIGRELLDWLVDHARSQGCAELHLDSATRRLDAHRFYLRVGMAITSHHFGMKLAPA